MFTFPIVFYTGTRFKQYIPSSGPRQMALSISLFSSCPPDCFPCTRVCSLGCLVNVIIRCTKSRYEHVQTNAQPQVSPLECHTNAGGESSSSCYTSVKKLSPGKRTFKPKSESECSVAPWRVTARCSNALFESGRVRVRQPWPGSPRMKESPNQSPKQQASLDFSPTSPSYPVFPKQLKSPSSARRVLRKRTLKKAKVKARVLIMGDPL